MKIKIKVPGTTDWPEQYRGKEVDVEIFQIIFEDNTYWSIQGFDFKIISSKDNPQGLQSIFGQELKSMTVDFK